MSDDNKFMCFILGVIGVMFTFLAIGGIMEYQKDAREDQLIAEMVKAGVPVSEAILAVREVR